jgi:uncharacterized membrane protein (UPF0182 family)
VNRRWIAAAVAAGALTLLIGRSLASAFVEYQWFQSLGAGEVWRVRALDTLLVRSVGSLVGALFAFANLAAVSNSIVSLVLPRRVANIEIGERVPGTRLVAAAAVASVLVGVLLSFALDDWWLFDRAWTMVPFGEQEGFSERDLSFFVYWLPVERGLYAWSLLSLFAVSTLVLALYALTTSLRWQRGRLHVTGYVRRHLTVLGVVLLLLLAWGHRLDAYALLSSGSGPLGAFTYVDHAVTQPSRNALAVFTAVAALLVLRGGWMGQPRLAFGAVTAVLAATVLLHVVVPRVAGRVWQPVDHATRTRDFQTARALVTQRAYGVSVPPFDTSAAALDTVPLVALAAGVPLWDPPALVQAVERGRHVGVVTGEIGWQLLGGRLVAIAGERARVPGAEDDPAASWSLLRVAGTVTDERGAPLFVDAEGNATRSDAAPELDVVVHPGAVGSLLVSDTGGRVVGEPARTWLARVAHAWSERDLGLASADRLPRLAPEIVRRRDPRERVGALAPYFAQGSTVSALALGDSLFWTLELYSTSTSYPLSQHYAIVGAERAYFQHAATAVVSAQTGAVRLIPGAAPDRIAQGWFDRFPSLYRPRATVPPALLAALPPATDGALAQAQVFAQFGLRNQSRFVAREFPRSDGSDSTLVEGAPALLVLERHGRPALSWTVPLLERASLRVAGLVVATGGVDRAVVWVPSQATAARWTEVNERLQRAADSLAVQRTGAGDAPVIRGRVRAMPAAGGFAYAQPFYAVRSDGVPAFAFAALLAGDSVTAGPTVGAAAGGGIPAGAALAGETDVRVRAASLYDAMREALGRGDWAAFGAAFDTLGALLGRAPR